MLPAITASSCCKQGTGCSGDTFRVSQTPTSPRAKLCWQNQQSGELQQGREPPPSTFTAREVMIWDCGREQQDNEPAVAVLVAP